MYFDYLMIGHLHCQFLYLNMLLGIKLAMVSCTRLMIFSFTSLNNYPSINQIWNYLVHLNKSFENKL